MNFFPKSTKFRKIQKGRIKGLSATNIKLTNGNIGLKSLEIGRITPSHIESCRQNIARKLKSTSGKLWINIFCHTSITSKAVGVRMGKGKGAVDYWASAVRPGQIIFEVSGVPYILAKSILLKASSKLPVRTKIVVR
jgi:large subunit ribosomal protein L16